MTVTQSVRESRIVVPADEPVLVVDRLVEAPRELVFRMYADPAHLVHFWGPHGSTTRIETMDFRPGGAWRLVIRFPGGGEIEMTSTYLEIVEPERIVFRHGAPDGSPDDPHADFVSTIRFDEEGATTRITAHIRFRSVAVRDDAAEHGFAQPVAQSLERLEAYLRQQ
jgi:uncharacterized protein YndB with AHSA1/START domain